MEIKIDDTTLVGMLDSVGRECSYEVALKLDVYKGRSIRENLGFDRLAQISEPNSEVQKPDAE